MFLCVSKIYVFPPKSRMSQKKLRYELEHGGHGGHGFYEFTRIFLNLGLKFSLKSKKIRVNS
ncbi:MAG: hypothetical protein RLZZ628_4262 [Bacteroidota bacterium]|jgi:hypothetical protein